MKNEVKIVGHCIVIVCEGKEIVRPLSQINYCEAICRHCLIFFSSGESQKAIIGIHELAQLLPKELFHFCHKSFIVHFGILKEAVVKGYTILYHGQTLHLSRYKSYDFWQKAFAYFIANE